MPAFLKLFERIVILALILMMVVVILLATAQLGWSIFQDIVTPPVLLAVDEVMDIFGLFLLVLIGVELLETIRAYLSEHVVHVEIVLEVGLIAIARKLIILDVKDLPSLTLIGIAALILALALASYLERRVRREVQPTEPKGA